MPIGWYFIWLFLQCEQEICSEWMRQIRYRNFASCFIQWTHESFFGQDQSLAGRAAEVAAAVFILRTRQGQNNRTRAEQNERKTIKMQGNLDLRWGEVRWKKKAFFGGSTPVLSFTPQSFNTSLLSNVSTSISRLCVAQIVRQHLNSYFDTFQCQKHRTCICVLLFSTI